MIDKKAIAVSVLALAVAACGLFLPVGKDGSTLGGSVYNRVIEFNEGITVDGTTVIDGSGNFDGAVTGTTGTFSSTLGVTGVITASSGFTLAGSADFLSVATTAGLNCAVGDMALNYVTAKLHMCTTTNTWSNGSQL